MEFPVFRRASWLEAAGREFLAVDDSPDAFGPGRPTSPVGEVSDDDCLEPAKQRRKTLLHAAESDAKRRERLLNSWLSVLLIAPEATATGVFLAKRQCPLQQMSILKSVVSGKATPTLASRLSAITTIISWLDAKRESGDQTLTDYSWPPDEEAVFCFLSEMAQASQPLSRASSCLEALKFFVFTFQALKTMKLVVSSPVLAGIALERKSLMGVRRQAANLTASQLKDLGLKHGFLDTELPASSKSQTTLVFVGSVTAMQVGGRATEG